MTSHDTRLSLDAERHEDRYTPDDLPPRVVDASRVHEIHRRTGIECACGEWEPSAMRHEDHVALELDAEGLLRDDRQRADLLNTIAALNGQIERLAVDLSVARGIKPFYTPQETS